MKKKELNTTLRDQARELGLCDEWYKGWKSNETQQELIDRYYKGIDFCIKHDYPRLEFIKKTFPKSLLLENGLFVDENFDASNLRRSVLLGCSKGEMIFYGNISSNVYVRHQSIVNITATDGAKVFVETYEDCKVNVFADEYSKVFVYKHGGEVSHKGNVVVRNRIAEG